MLLRHIWDIFDVVFKVILGIIILGALVSKCLVTRQGLVVEHNGLKFETQGF